MRYMRPISIMLVKTLFMYILAFSVAEAHKEWVHQYLVMESYRLLKLQTKIDQTSPLFDSFFTYAFRFPEHKSLCSTTDAAYAEDLDDILYNNYGWIGEQISATHFWDADEADPYRKNSLEWLSGTFNNAFEKAEMLWNGNRNLFMPGPWNFQSYASESAVLRAEGIDEYSTYLSMIIQYESLPGMLKNRQYSFVGVVTTAGNVVMFSQPHLISQPSSLFDVLFSANILGRIAHLLGDMSVPAHVHIVSHPCDIGYGAKYELFMGSNDTGGCNDLHTSFTAQQWTHQTAYGRGGFINVVGSNNPMKSLFYMTNQVTDVYREWRNSPGPGAVTIYDGDRNYSAIDPLTGDNYQQMTATIDDIPTSFSGLGEEMTNCATMSFVFAMRSTAGLFHWFAIEAGLVPPPPPLVPLPAAPILLSPANQSTNTSTTPTLSWSSSEGATSYEVILSPSSKFFPVSIFEQGITGTSFNATGLSNNATYYWRVFAVNDGGSVVSERYSFTTQPAPPPAPTLISPANGATGVSVSPTLSWNASAGASTYTLQVAMTEDFSSPIINLQNIAGTSTSVGLDYNTTYYWRVKAVNAGGESAWSTPTWNFTTEIRYFTLTINSPCGLPTNPSPGPHSFTEGTVVNVSVTSTVVSGGSGTQYVFTDWSGAVNSTNASVPVMMDSDKEITANCKTQYELIVNCNYGLGTSGAGWYDGGVMATACVNATSVTDGETRYTFSTWGGDASGTSACTGILMNGPKTAWAYYNVEYYLSMSKSGPCGSVSPASGWYPGGEAVEINAYTSGNCVFEGWSGSGFLSTSSSSATAYVEMFSPISEHATFDYACIERSASPWAYASNDLESAVIVQWGQPSGTCPLSFNIYRQSGGGGNWELIAQGYSGLSMVDYPPPYDYGWNVYFYRIVTVSTTGQESGEASAEGAMYF